MGTPNPGLEHQYPPPPIWDFKVEIHQRGTVRDFFSLLHVVILLSHGKGMRRWSKRVPDTFIAFPGKNLFC